MTADTNMAHQPSPLVQYWHDTDVPSDVAKGIATFRDCNPDMTHLLFDQADARQFIAERFTEREVAAFDSCAVPAMQADYFRYCAVLTLGGTYADADLICSQSLASLLGNVNSGLFFKARLTGATFATPDFFFVRKTGHPMLRLLLEIATVNIEQRISTRVGIVTGPWLMTVVESMHRRGSLHLPVSAGDPVSPLVGSIARTVGEFHRIAQAFDGVQVLWRQRLAGWIQMTSDLEYKTSDTHWPKWQAGNRSIFRQTPHWARGDSQVAEE